MASVYVSGDRTKILQQFEDRDSDHDHTYFGSGCATTSGSDVPCGLFTATTFDNETQDIGTYYTFQAAATGSGGSTSKVDNTVVPDTFCPLGWQMPYGGTGGDYYDKPKSFGYLFTTYSMTSSSHVKFGSYPFSNNRSGYFSDTAKVSNASVSAISWTSTINSASGAYRLGMFGSAMEIDRANGKPFEFTVRCSFLHRRHGGKRICEWRPCKKLIAIQGWWN